MSKFLNAHAKVILYKSKVLADGNHPVMLRITFLRKQKYYSTPFKLSSIQFDKLYSGERLKRNDSDILTQLMSIEIQAKNVIKGLLDKKSFSFTQFEQQFFINKADSNVFRLLDNRIKYHDQKGAFKSRDICKTVSSKLVSFWGSQNLNLEDITVAFLEQFEIKNKHLAPNTIGVYERCLRTIYNEAISNRIISPELNPFKRHRIPSRPGIKKALNKMQVLEILNHPTDIGSFERLAQQIFIFSYLCNGMNLKDIANLRWTDISDGRILFIRSKTQNTQTTPKVQSIEIQEPTQLILTELGIHKTSETDYIFPIYNKSMNDEQRYDRLQNFNGVLNRNIRKIAAQLGIDKDFTFYSARHSYATVLKRSGVSVEVISEGMSHSNIRVTQIYLDSFGDDELDKANRNLL